MKKLSRIIPVNLVIIFILLFSFASPALAAPGDTNPGALTLKATYQSISVYAPFTGDSGADNSATLHYRTPPGSGSWIPGMDMTVDRRTTVDSQANPYYNQWRASILGLQPNTTYEVRVTFTDGGQQGTVTSTITTRNDDFDSLSPAGTDYYVATTGNDDPGGGSIGDPWQTIQYAVDHATTPGDTVYVRGGTYIEGQEIKVGQSGTAANYITVRNYPGETVTVDARTNPTGCGQGWSSAGFHVWGNYIRIKGFEILGARNGSYRMGILVGPRSSVDSAQPHDVVIEDNVIRDYKTLSSSPGPYTPIWIGAQSESWSTDVYNITVQGNSLYLFEPGATSADYGTGPGIWMIRANGGHVIRNNSIYFSGTLTVHGRDGVNSTPNFTFVDTITDSDIHGNYIEGATDDGISIDGNAANVRIWDNTIERAMMGISITPVYIGPVYVFRNVWHDPQRHWANYNGWIKAGNKDAGPQTGYAYFYHNTVVYDDLSLGQSTPYNMGFTQEDGSATNVILKNNIIETNGPVTYSNNPFPIMDANLIYNHDRDKYWAKWNGYSSIYDIGDFRSVTGQEANGIGGQALYVNRNADDFHLADESPGIDNGVPITGFNDRYSAWPSNGNPDMGAYENGATSEDNESPYTTGHDPAIEAVKISPDTNITVHVKDNDSGVDQDSIVMTIGGIAVSPTITGTPSDYTLTYNPSSDFEESQVVNVTVDAQDLSSTPNIMSQDAYYFTIINTSNNAPVLEPIGDKTINEGEMLWFAVAATDQDGDTLTYTADNLPVGAVFDASTRTFTWTPSYLQAGSYPNVHFEVSDGLNSASEDINITVKNTNRQPEADAGTDQQGLVNNLVTLDGTGSNDPDGDPLTYIWTQASGPSVRLYYETSRTPFFTPSTAGTYVFSLVVNDGTVYSNIDSVSITVVNWPVLPIRVNVGGVEYTDTDANLWWADQSYASGLWGYLDGSSADRGSIAIGNTSDDPIYQTERWGLSGYQFDVGNGTYDVVLHFAETYTGITGAGQRIFDVFVEGQLALDNLDVYSEAGSSTALIKTINNVTVADGQLNIEFISSTEEPEINGIEILKSNDPPALVSIGNKSVAEGELLQFVVSATDPDGDLLTYSVTNLPSGSSFDPATQTFSWTPDSTQVGDHPGIHFEVTDGLDIDSEDITISVSLSSDITAPEITGISANNVGESSVDINWITDEMSTSQVEYWASPVEMSPKDHELVTHHNVALTGLSPNTTYNYRVYSEDAAGNLAISAEGTFMTMNHAPVAQDDNISTDKNTSVVIDILANDSDPDGDMMTVTIVSQPSHGTVTLNTDQTVTYSPDTDFSGTDSFTYVLFDGMVNSDTAAVTVTINDLTPPTAYINIEMSKREFRKWTWITSYISVTEANEDAKRPLALAGVTVIGHWNDDYNDSVTGITDKKGKISFKTKDNTSGTVTFTVDKVIVDGLEYELTGETQDSITLY